MGQMVNSSTETRRTRIRSQASPFEICGGQIGTATGFVRVRRFPLFSVSFHQSSSLRFSYRRDQQVKFGNLPKSNASTEIWNHLVAK
jgi:hypothetical protein